MEKQISFGPDQSKKNIRFVILRIVPFEMLYLLYLVYLIKTMTVNFFHFIPFIVLALLVLIGVFSVLAGIFKYENGKLIFRSRLFGKVFFSVEPAHVKSIEIVERTDEQTGALYKVIVITDLDGAYIDFLASTDEKNDKETEKLFVEIKTLLPL